MPSSLGESVETLSVMHINCKYLYVRKFPSKISYDEARNSLNGPNTNSKATKSDLTGFVVAIVALSPQYMLRLHFALLVSMRARASAPRVLRVFPAVM